MIFGRSCAAALLLALSLHAQSSLADRVLVVYNATQSDSRQVAQYYIAKRGIPKTNVCEIKPSTTEQIKQDEFDSSIKPAIRKCLDRVGKDKILYVVFSYQTPWLLEMPTQTNALDQFVADIWDEYLPERAPNQNEVQPYFGIAQSEGELFQPFVPLADYRRQSNARTIYSVWRLDAPTAALAKGLVDKALAAEANGLSGNACFDRRTDPVTAVPDFGYGAGDWQIHAAADLARKAGFTVIEDGHSEEFGTAPAPLRCDHAALYAGWYALNHYNDAFSWNPGAIGIHLDSASATNPRGGDNWATHALARGITVTAGATTEPYLENLPHPDQALWCLFHGANVGDALLRSERLLKWRIINMGDPLYRPFPNGAATAARVEPDLVLGLGPQLTLGNLTSVGVVGTNRLAPAGGLTFSLKSENPQLATVPATVSINPGNGVVKFPVQTHRTNADTTTVRIIATGNGLTRSNTLIVLSAVGPVIINPNTLKGGSPATGTVQTRRPAQSAVTVTLKSDHPDIVSVPVEISIPPGKGGASFPIATRAVNAKTSVTITASYADAIGTGSVTVVP